VAVWAGVVAGDGAGILRERSRDRRRQEEGSAKAMPREENPDHATTTSRNMPAAM
jgi:hypothetical protein